MMKKNGGLSQGDASRSPGSADQKRMSRLQVMLSSDELLALDNFRFEKRMPSRASAIREILRRGLRADGFAIAAEGSHSKAFGVLRNGTYNED